MCSKSQLSDILSRIDQFSKGLFGPKLVHVVLYGSYARGDYNSESDIDVMILVDINKEELSRYRSAYAVLTSDLGLDYDVLIAPTLQDKTTFDTWSETIPFYQNVKREGVVVDA